MNHESIRSSDADCSTGSSSSAQNVAFVSSIITSSTNDVSTAYDGYDWTGHAEDEQKNFALMAYSHSGSDIEVTSCSKECEESYAKLRKLYDEQREQLGDASIEIKAYTLALAK
ncbi:hypothetical protein Tco_1551939, partial [Tanacetum coccineum]